MLTMSSHSMAISCVRWGGEDLIYSASRDCAINVWHAQAGALMHVCSCGMHAACQGSALHHRSASATVNRNHPC